jgi:hypothetical protein
MVMNAALLPQPLTPSAITGTECMGPGVRRDDGSYLVNAGNGFTLSSGIPACMVISVIDTRS